MNATTTTEAPIRAPYFITVRPGTLDWTIFGQLCICIIPAMIPLDFAAPKIGAQYLAGSLFLFLAYYFVRRDRFRYMSLLVGAGPALSLLRGVFFYDSIFIFLLMGCVLWAYTAWEEVRWVWGDYIWRSLAFFCLIYWALTVVLKGNFGANIRALELTLAPPSICLLSNRRSYLATGLIGIAMSSTAYAIAMLPYGVRLGEGELDNGQTIGNPALVGLPSALMVLLCVTDRGRSLLLESKATGRLAVCLVAGQWLILSGSRGSWLITIACLTIVFAYSKVSRKTILGGIAVGCIAAMVVISTTNRGSQASKVFDKPLDSNRSLANRTSGRSSMWAALPAIFAASPVWGWGPGSGADVDYLYTHRHLIFHSLYEQIIAECGLLGIIPLMIILFALLRRGIMHYRRWGELVPLVGIVGFMLIGVSVTAFDFVSGVFFGLALMSHEPNPRYTMRELSATAMTEEEALMV